MPLQHGGDAQPGHLVRHAGFEVAEFDAAFEDGVEAHRKARRLLLAAQRGFQLAVAAIDDDPVARDEGRHEERQAHDVVPVQVGHEDVVRLRVGAVPGHDRLPERAHAAAEVAYHVGRPAGLDLHAG